MKKLLFVAVAAAPRMFKHIVILTLPILLAVSVQAQVRGIDATLALPTVQSVTISPASTVGGPALLGTVLLNTAATRGATVKLTSSSPAKAVVPASVIVQAGASSATFVVQTYPVPVSNAVIDPSVEITAQIGTSRIQTTVINVYAPTLTALTIDPASVPGGQPSMGMVTLNGVAAAPGVTIGLKRADVVNTDPRFLLAFPDPPPATFPELVAVPAGSTSATFPITTTVVSAIKTVEIIANLGVFVTRNAILTLQPPRVNSVSLNPATFPAGSSSTGTISLTAPAAAGGMPFPLWAAPSGGSTYTCGPTPTIPSTVTVPAGATSVTFPVTTKDAVGGFVIGVGGSPPTFGPPDPVTSGGLFIRQPSLFDGSLTLPASIKGGLSLDVTLRVVGVLPAVCWTDRLALTSSDALVLQVPEYAYIKRGTSEGQFQITTSAVSSPQTVSITVAGIGGPKTWTITVTP